MSRRMIIAGGGIGGLAAALACSRAGVPVALYERADAFEEIGAGIQLGPNVTRLLHGWGLAQELESVAAFPMQLQVRSAMTGRELGVLPLGEAARRRYGAPYATLHRADLQQLLLAAVRQEGNAGLHCGQSVATFTQTQGCVTAQMQDGSSTQADLLLGADGLWSQVRQGLLNDGPPRVTGHLAYRAIALQAHLPMALRSSHVTIWLGPDLHVVQYPVRRGERLNVVAIVQSRATRGETRARTGAATQERTGAEFGAGPEAVARSFLDEAPADPLEWDQHTTAAGLRVALGAVCSPLQNMCAAMDGWRRWVLCDRAPLQGAEQLARGRVALLGDAAHPMLPYLAQGAGMAIEDAAMLGRVLTDARRPVDAALAEYAGQRWQRNARVQARAIRNGHIFHASGPLRAGRDISMRLLGERLLDMPWLYGEQEP